MLVHDLRTPLTTMIAPLEMLRKGQLGGLQQTQQEAVEMCTRGGYRLLALINELLDISKQESGEMKLERREATVADLVQQSIDELRQLVRNQDIEILVDLDPALPTATVDDDLIRRVLTNLIGNAIKFSSRGGAVMVKATDDGVTTSVHDAGPGVPSEAQTRIFEKFGQDESRQEGRKMSTGLGLTFCKLAIAAHGGTIWVESTPGSGSTFKFTVPLAPVSD